MLFKHPCHVLQRIDNRLHALPEFICRQDGEVLRLKVARADRANNLHQQRFGVIQWPEIKRNDIRVH